VPTLAFTRLTLDALDIEDERSFRGIALYADLKAVLKRAGYAFRILPDSLAGRWDRALLLNLTYWVAGGDGDILVDRTIPADVITHAAWHHLAARALETTPGEPMSAAALFMGEAIASAFDAYLVGRLVGVAPESSMLETQVPAMSECAEAAGLDAAGFDALMQEIGAEPERAFESLRQLLFDATCALLRAPTAEAALDALAGFDTHRFASLLHHYELSNWVLYARAYAPALLGPDARVRALDATLRAERDSLARLTTDWVRPALRD